MKAKNYLSTEAFKVSSPAQGLSRESSMLVINDVAVTYSTIKYNFASGVIDKLLDNRTNLQHFDGWIELIEAIHSFMRDVDLCYPSSPVSLGYDADMSDSDIETIERPKLLLRMV